MSGPLRYDDTGSRPLELLSVVAPVYNEEATIQEFKAGLAQAPTADRRYQSAPIE